MTAKQFRELALGLPGVVEAAHMDHPDFRVGGRIFATLSSREEEWGMVKVTPDQQAALLEAEPDVYTPASGAWGRQGCTMVRLRLARSGSVTASLLAAWRNTAPKRLLEKHPTVLEKLGGEETDDTRRKRPA